MVEFFEEADKRLFLRFKNAESNPEAIVDVYRQAQALEGFKMFIQSVLVDGKRAEKELSKE